MEENESHVPTTQTTTAAEGGDTENSSDSNALAKLLVQHLTREREKPVYQEVTGRNLLQMCFYYKQIILPSLSDL